MIRHLFVKNEAANLFRTFLRIRSQSIDEMKSQHTGHGAGRSGKSPHGQGQVKKGTRAAALVPFITVDYLLTFPKFRQNLFRYPLKSIENACTGRGDRFEYGLILSSEFLTEVLDRDDVRQVALI